MINFFGNIIEVSNANLKINVDHLGKDLEN